jgi:hypothetical protein
MVFDQTKYDAATLAVLNEALDAAWAEVRNRNLDILRKFLAARIMVAAQDGERDPQKLKGAAVGVLRRIGG